MNRMPESTYLPDPPERDSRNGTNLQAGFSVLDNSFQVWTMILLTDFGRFYVVSTVGEPSTAMGDCPAIGLRYLAITA